MEDLERALALPHFDREGIAALVIVDGHEHAPAVLTPQKPYIDPSLMRLCNSRIDVSISGVISSSSEALDDA
jgi:hypothetical protein